MKKKIFIPYATYGSGHKAIANYVEKYFNTMDPDIEILTLDLLEYSTPIIGNITKNISGFLMLKQPKVWDVIFKISDNKLSAAFFDKLSLRLLKSKKLKRIIENFNPDLTIAPHFMGSSLIGYYNKKGITNSKVITIVTDYVAHEAWIKTECDSDYLIVCSREEKKYLVNNKNIDKNKIKTYGIPIYPATNLDFNKTSELKKLGLSKNNLTCVFFLGGGYGSTATLPYVKRLLKTNLDMNYIFISGRNERAKKKILEYVERYDCKNVIVYGYVNNALELIKTSDFVISKPGGAQTTECLYFKKPLLMLRSSGGQEDGNIKYITKKGYGKMFKRPRTLVKFVSKISNKPDTLAKIQNNLNKMNHQDAMEKIYKLAINLLNK